MEENNLIHTFPKGISTTGNTNSLGQELYLVYYASSRVIRNGLTKDEIIITVTAVGWWIYQDKYINKNLIPDYCHIFSRFDNCRKLAFIYFCDTFLKNVNILWKLQKIIILKIICFLKGIFIHTFQLNTSNF